MLRAVEGIRADAMRQAIERAKREQIDKIDPFSPAFKPQAKVETGAAAEAIADRPLLTGNAEWDAVELAETDPMREPFDNAFLGRFLKPDG